MMSEVGSQTCIRKLGEKKTLESIWRAMASGYNFLPPQILDINDSNVAEKWKKKIPFVLWTASWNLLGRWIVHLPSALGWVRVAFKGFVMTDKWSKNLPKYRASPNSYWTAALSVRTGISLTARTLARSTRRPSLVVTWLMNSTFFWFGFRLSCFRLEDISLHLSPYKKRQI